MEFSWRRNDGTISLNLGVVWGMSVHRGLARSLGTVDWDDAVRLAEVLFVEAKFKHENGLSVTPHGLACRFNRRRRCQRRRPCL